MDRAHSESVEVSDSHSGVRGRAFSGLGSSQRRVQNDSNHYSLLTTPEIPLILIGDGLKPDSVGATRKSRSAEVVRSVSPFRNGPSLHARWANVYFGNFPHRCVVDVFDRSLSYLLTSLQVAK